MSEDKIKVSNPGVLQIRRFVENGKFVTDVLYNEEDADLEKIKAYPLAGRQAYEAQGEAVDLLQTVFENGNVQVVRKTCQEIQKYAAEQVKMIPDDLRELKPTKNYLVGLERRLNELKNDLIEKARG